MTTKGRARWAEDPANCTGTLRYLLPPALPSHPPVISAESGPATLDPAAIEDARNFIRAERLFWPTPRPDAISAPVVVDLSGAGERDGAWMLALVLTQTDPRDVLVVASGGRLRRLAAARGCSVAPGLQFAEPQALFAVYGAPDADAQYWAAIGGLKTGTLTKQGISPVDPEPWLLRAEARDPWRGKEIGLADGLEALAFLHAAARRNARPRATIAMSRWKRRNIAPFLDGPTGPALHFRTARKAQKALGDTGVLVVWGNAPPPDFPRVERAEDGFIRSVGLGVRHTPPASLAIEAGGMHFDAEGDNSFIELARDATYTPTLLARAARLRETVIRQKITKYNLAAGAAPPDTGARLRLLVPGQVEGDASLTYGSPNMKTNTALLRAARARHPDAFLLYKPHPDVLTGLRPGAVDAATLALADSVATDVSAEACLDWADAIETMTSLMGFEALMRGKAVATHGRPFYAGWGLAEDLSGAAPRGALSLDQLVAAALILYPRYIDPITRLPAPPEVIIAALATERGGASAPAARLRLLHRRLASSFLNQFS